MRAHSCISLNTYQSSGQKCAHHCQKLDRLTSPSAKNITLTCIQWVKFISTNRSSITLTLCVVSHYACFTTIVSQCLRSLPIHTEFSLVPNGKSSTQLPIPLESVTRRCILTFLQLLLVCCLLYPSLSLSLRNRSLIYPQETFERAIHDKILQE